MAKRSGTNRDLLPREVDEIRAFAKVEGRPWKSTLQRESWWRGLPAKDRNGKEYPSLYGLRNTHGPSWLMEYRIPKEETRPADAIAI
jgi:hypothetical protein